MIKLNLGCGLKKINGYINVDNRLSCEPDLVHDLNVFPYPFTDNYASEIIMDHVIEHLNDPMTVLQELFRISAPGAKIFINCPHFSANWSHPGHKSAIGVHFFDFLRESGDEVYGSANFQVNKLELRWFCYNTGKRSLMILRILSKIINYLANLSPRVAERFWCYYVGGFEEIRFEITAKK